MTTLSAASLAILKTKGLIDVNQDALGVQGTLRVAMDTAGHRAPKIPAPEPEPERREQPTAMTHCTFGIAPAAQQWKISGQRLISMQGRDKKCLARTITGAVEPATCDPNSKLQAWDFARVNQTISQVMDAGDPTSCLTFNSSSLHMEVCEKEAGDKTKPNLSGCKDGNCRFSGIIYQLWYLNSLAQMTSSITNIPNGGSTLLPMIQGFPSNTPWCLATSPNAAPPPPPTAPAVDSSQPLQVWAGPLSGGDVVVVLLNAGNGTQKITASLDDIGLTGVGSATATDLWTGKPLGAPVVGNVSAHVASHDSAAYRLSPKP